MPILLPGKKKPQDLILYGKNLALLGAFCLFLSAVEYMIPKPLPFMRIGLANLPLILALDIFPLYAFLILVCVKVLGQALITGTLFSYIFLFSLTGTFLSALLMFLLRRIFCLKLSGHERITFIGIGTAGAMVSNLSQLALARVFIFRENIIYITPVFLLSGLITGIVLGIFCEVFADRSRWYLQHSFRRCKEEIKEQINKKEEREDGIKERAEIEKKKGGKRLEIYKNLFSANALFITGFLIIPALLFNPDTGYRFVQFFFFMFLVWVCGKKVNFIFTFLIITGIVLFNLIIPYGRVLFSFGAFKITSGALTAGIHRAVTLYALVMVSKVTIRQDIKIPGFFGELLCESLRIFSVLMNRKNHITAKNFINNIDRMMLELSAEEVDQTPVQLIRTKPAGYVILITVIIISWIPWVMNFF